MRYGALSRMGKKRDQRKKRKRKKEREKILSVRYDQEVTDMSEKKKKKPEKKRRE